ncbi:hypothetical protein GW17_00012411 [Ensete ventricosum]|nr:hypothetical protein GW17_00012411 [Ensete ventricosum]
MRSPARGCDLCGHQRMRSACHLSLLARPLLHVVTACPRDCCTAATVSRLWQTRVRPPLDAAVAYAQSTQRHAWVVNSMTAIVSALCAHAAECSNHCNCGLRTHHDCSPLGIKEVLFFIGESRESKVKEPFLGFLGNGSPPPSPLSFLLPPLTVTGTKPVCASSPTVVSVRSWSSIGWVEPRGPAREVDCWNGGAQVGLEYSSTGRPLTPARRSGQVGSRRDPSDGQVSSMVGFVIPLLRRGAGAFIVSDIGHSYLISLLPLFLTIPSYLSTTPAVLTVRRAPVGEGCRPYLC